jgi:drug/metabolite transporter (DMT)-like permease
MDAGHGGRVTRTYVGLLLLLGSIWGSSYLFIKVAGRELQPATITELRLLFTIPVLGVVIGIAGGFRRTAAEVWSARREGIVLGAMNAIVPFTLIAWGEKYIDSGVAAIGNASIPIFVALLAIRMAPAERSHGWRLVGVLIGLVGVGVLVGVQPGGSIWAVLGMLAVIFSSISYAWSNLYARGRIHDVRGPVLTMASAIGAAVMLAPVGLAQAPGHVPSWQALASVAALGIGGTAVAQVLFFKMLKLYGSSRSTLVSYVIPVMALFYGIVFLGEPLRLSALVGLVLILLGVGLGSGALRLGRGRLPVTASVEQSGS